MTPSIELHLHLEGAAPPAFIAGLAAEKRIDISGIFDAAGGYLIRDFWHFLEVYEAATSVLQTPADFHRLTRAVLAESAASGVIYTEAFLSPDFCGGGDLAAWRDYLAAIRQAADEAEADSGIVMRGIVTCIRHFGPDQARQTARCAAETADDWLVGFGMAGDERKGRPGDFAYSFDMAREAGLSLTSHAGEWNGPAEVAATLDALAPARIGHGVRAIEDPALVERLARERITLEVCPGSNVALGVYPALDRHPIERLRAAGVPVTVSTDDPPFFHTTMRREFETLAETFGWDGDTIAGITETALDAAFCDGETKASLRKRIAPA